MNNMNPLLLVDSYKIHHYPMYEPGMTKLYSNGTCRKSRIKDVNHVVVFGIQHFVQEYLIKKFNEDFFYTDRRNWQDIAFKTRESHNKLNIHENETIRIKELKKLKSKVIDEYKRHCPVDTTHIEALWDLGYLPIEIKALDEGTLCPIGVPMLTITNTHPEFAWLVNYLETLISASIWQSYTSATIAHEYKKILTKYCLETDEKNIEFINWQGHDFSMRGMSSVESSILSGMGHLLSFTGTDTIPAIYQLEKSYNASGLIGASVPATEHSVMCMGTKESEINTFKRLLDLYPTGILSVVSDTWDLWKVCTEYLPLLKDQILARDGKLVIRPDSGDPVDIICGTNPKDYLERKSEKNRRFVKGKFIREAEYKGVIELLWDVFGGTVNDQGYKVLDSHIGAIYGDSITLERAKEICERLKAKGFASTNVVFGIGSYTYQYNTRDTFGFAMKATYGEITHKQLPLVFEYSHDRVFPEVDETILERKDVIECREIWKDPITDDGTKKSKKGLLQVIEAPVIDGKNNPTQIGTSIICIDQCTWEQEKEGLLTTVFIDGKLVKHTTLEEIRNKLKVYYGKQ